MDSIGPGSGRASIASDRTHCGRRRQPALVSPYAPDWPKRSARARFRHAFATTVDASRDVQDAVTIPICEEPAFVGGPAALADGAVGRAIQREVGDQGDHVAVVRLRRDLGAGATGPGQVCDLAAVGRGSAAPCPAGRCRGSGAGDTTCEALTAAMLAGE